MKYLPLAIAAAALAMPAAAQVAPAPRLSLEHRMMLRCSAVFALVAGEQQRGVASARAYPPLAERGREFFVRSNARLMDELSLSRDQIAELLRAEVDTMQRASAEAADPAAYVDSVMQPCLSALEASGL